MTQPEFLAEMKLIADAIRGKGKDISQSAGIHYNTYLNYIRGTGTDTEVMVKILTEAQKIARELKAHLNAINI